MKKKHTRTKLGNYFKRLENNNVLLVGSDINQKSQIIDVKNISEKYRDHTIRNISEYTQKRTCLSGQIFGFSYNTPK